MANYFVKSGTGGTDNGADWANAAESIAGLMAAQAIAGGDTIYVHNTHSYNAGGAITWTLPESGTGLVRVLCVDGGDPTGASLSGTTVGSMTTGAVEGTNANSTFTIATGSATDAMLYVQGMKIQSGQAGQSQASADISIGGSAIGRIKFVECAIELLSTAIGQGLFLGSQSAFVQEYENCTWKFGATGQGLSLQGSPAYFKNCKIDSAGSSPTTLFQTGSVNRLARIICESCDWSLAGTVVGTSVAVSGLFSCFNCAMATPTSGSGLVYNHIASEFMACAAADGTNGADILSYYYEDPSGTVQDNQTVYKATSGAQGEQDDGTDTSYSLQLDPSTRCSTSVPLYTPWIHTFVSSAGDKTVTMKVAHTEPGESVVLTTADIWMEVQYMGEPGLTGTQRVANSPHAQIEVDDNCDLQSSTLSRDILAAGSNRTDDALDDWTGLTSEKEHTLTASINCAEIGYIRCRVGLGKDTTNPVYVDPKIGVV